MFNKIMDALRDSLTVMDNPNFREWFNGSKVVDREGRPLVVYHGTNSEFTEFKDEFIGIESGGYGGFFFTTNESHAKLYPPRSNTKVLAVFLSIKNPVIISNRQWYSDDLLDPSEYEEDGYDGYFIKGLEQDNGGRSDTYIAFYPNQIKSATDNNGNFDPNDPDITH